MKQENRFVAQFFHYLAPFVDMERELFICVDGGAAKHHAGRPGSAITDADVPDLWFALIGRAHHIGVEAKVIDGTTVSVRQGQLRAWRTGGIGHYRPNFWVTTNRTLTEYSCWHHATLLPRLDQSSSTTANVTLSLSKFPADYSTKSLPALALYVLRHA